MGFWFGSCKNCDFDLMMCFRDVEVYIFFVVDSIEYLIYKMYFDIIGWYVVIFRKVWCIEDYVKIVYVGFYNNKKYGGWC